MKDDDYHNLKIDSFTLWTMQYEHVLELYDKLLLQHY